ncbi:hypothetical protein [Novilysobacter erysipheiresistens]|uniref:Uncharacterized protein n=1 Tax=Novilysobacter erysipheiresistens TaxID=1749332 RepID=A0ABU7YWU9_9GAMM
MNKTALSLSFLLLAASAAQAQETLGCPQLPADTGLTWEHRANGGSDFCRALRADGSEALGLYIAAEASFEPKRDNREENDLIDGRPVQWYRAELVTKPDIEARETLIQLDDGRVAHLWLQAPAGAQLNQAFELTRQLRFGPPQQVAAGE